MLTIGGWTLQTYLEPASIFCCAIFRSHHLSTELTQKCSHTQHIHLYQTKALDREEDDAEMQCEASQMIRSPCFHMYETNNRGWMCHYLKSMKARTCPTSCKHAQCEEPPGSWKLVILWNLNARIYCFRSQHHFRLYKMVKLTRICSREHPNYGYWRLWMLEIWSADCCYFTVSVIRESRSATWPSNRAGLDVRKPNSDDGGMLQSDIGPLKINPSWHPNQFKSDFIWKEG